MHLPDITLHQAATLEQAAGLMNQFGTEARCFAGGTDVLVDLKTGRFRARHLISIGRIEELHGIRTADTSVRIGASTTISQLQRSDIIHEHLPILQETAGQMASTQVRNVATVGGNIASAVPCADLPPVLMTLQAELVLWSPGGERRVPMESFFVGARQTNLAPDELLVAIIVPRPAKGCGHAYERFALRNGNAIAVASVAVMMLLEDELITDVRLALGAVSAVPKLVVPLPRGVLGAPVSEELFAALAATAKQACAPISDVRGSASYRRELVGTLALRALTRAQRRAKEIN